MSKMNPEIKQLWINELRNPDNKQITGRLKSDSGRCCIGVLADLAVEAGILKEVYSNATGDSGYQVIGEFSLERFEAPKALQGWAGLPSAEGHLPASVSGSNGRENVQYGSLVALNDSAGFTFAQIADVIEEYL